MIGFDLQEVERLKQPDKLLEKIALDSEKAYIEKFKQDYKMHVATLWACKEATFKALNLKNGEISYKDIEISHTQTGRPKIKLTGKAEAHFKELALSKIDISISHQEKIVGAVVICE